MAEIIVPFFEMGARRCNLAKEEKRSDNGQYGRKRQNGSTQYDNRKRSKTLIER